VLAPVKNNLAVFPPSQQFALEQAPDHDVARVKWLDTCALTADDLLSDGSGRGRPSGKKEEARDFLRDVLADGPVPKQDVQDEADERGIATRTLTRAKEALDVESEKQGFDEPWAWRLPDEGAPF
jgi:putative DNA primase/helicase